MKARLAGCVLALLLTAALVTTATAALPAKGETVEAWSEREVMRLAVVGRLAGDISGAIAAHRLLAHLPFHQLHQTAQSSRPYHQP